MQNVRVPLAIACICVLAAVMIVLVDAMGTTTHTVEIAGWGAFLVHGELALYHNNRIFFSTGFLAAAILFIVPAVDCIVVAFRRQRRRSIRGFPVEVLKGKA